MLKARVVAPKDFKLIAQREARAFPSESDDHGHIDIYKEWFDKKRNSSFVFEESDKVKGLLATIPVSKKGWDYIHNLHHDDLDEYKLTDDKLFNCSRDKQIGIHVYMIEKFDSNISNFTKVAYLELFKLLKNKFSISKNELLGISGYSVSPSAIHVAINVLGRVEVKPVSSAMFFNSDGKLVVKKVRNQKDFDRLLVEGCVFRNNCRLTSLTPKNPSIVWQWFDDALSNH